MNQSSGNGEVPDSRYATTEFPPTHISYVDDILFVIRRPEELTTLLAYLRSGLSGPVQVRTRIVASRQVSYLGFTPGDGGEDHLRRSQL